MNRHKLIEATCAICGQPFQARAADVRRGFGRTCSSTCAGKRPKKDGESPASHPLQVASHPSERPDQLPTNTNTAPMSTLGGIETEPTEEVSNLMKPEVPEERPLSDWDRAMRLAPVDNC